MDILTVPTPARQPGSRTSNPVVHLKENADRPEVPVPNQVFRVLTSDGSDVYLDGEFEGSFAGAMRHATTCARSVRAKHSLEFACADVHAADGALVYSVTAFISKAV